MPGERRQMIHEVGAKEGAADDWLHQGMEGKYALVEDHPREMVVLFMFCFNNFPETQLCSLWLDGSDVFLFFCCYSGDVITF
jgi:hypothetical protein